MNSTSEYAKKICRYLKDSNYRKVINCHLGMYNNMSDEKYLKMLFHAQMGKNLISYTQKPLMKSFNG